MSESKSFASLTSGLLARKGAAKPAMRRQGHPLPSDDADVPDDLGWNDMGYDLDPNSGNQDTPPAHRPANPLANAIPDTVATDAPATSDVPEVRKQHEELAARLSAGPTRSGQDEPGKPASNATNVDRVPVPLSISREVAPVAEHSAIGTAPPARPRKPATETKSEPAPKRPSRAAKAKAAFTLRLDPERHLRLRLASAVRKVSAQQMVTRALDQYLNSMPELDELVKRVPAPEAKQTRKTS